MSNRKAQQIANSIQLFTALPEGDALVQAVGNGDEKTNHEAIIHWVEKQADLLLMEDQEYMVKKFINRFQSKIHDFYAMSAY